MRHPPTPTPVILVATLLMLEAGVGLLACIFDKTEPIVRAYDGAEAVIVIVASTPILMNHRRALPFAFVSTLLLTIDLVRERGLFSGIPQSLAEAWQVARVLLNVALYWFAFLWYRRWHRNSRQESADGPETAP